MDARTAREEQRQRDFLVAALRAACARARLMEMELTEIGVALKAGLIGPDMAVKWLHDQQLLFLLGTMPDEIGKVALANLPAEQTSAGDQRDGAATEML